MRRRWAAGAAALVAAVGGVVVASTSDHRAATTPGQVPDTEPVAHGALSAAISMDGTLTYRAQPDGSPYVAINRAPGTYTGLPAAGTTVGCGDELYRVDEQPILLLCGAVPAYRDLHAGDAGTDVRQLNTNLHDLGLDAAAGAAIDPHDDTFTDRTQHALTSLQRERGVTATGELHADGAVVLPQAVRIATVAGVLGGSAQPGAPVLDATSADLEVHVELEGAAQREVELGQPARITLPSNTSATGTVARLGTVARPPAGQDEASGPATILAAIVLDHPAEARALDQAPVRVEVTTGGVDDALSVPVAAIVGRSGGGFAVEVVRAGGRRELVAVELGVFDASDGRVQVEGKLHEGDRTVVPPP